MVTRAAAALPPPPPPPMAAAAPFMAAAPPLALYQEQEMQKEPMPMPSMFMSSVLEPVSVSVLSVLEEAHDDHILLSSEELVRVIVMHDVLTPLRHRRTKKCRSKRRSMTHRRLPITLTRCSRRSVSFVRCCRCC
jgi:hypothetical protein